MRYECVMVFEFDYDCFLHSNSDEETLQLYVMTDGFEMLLCKIYWECGVWLIVSCAHKNLIVSATITSISSVRIDCGFIATCYRFNAD